MSWGHEAEINFLAADSEAGENDAFESEETPGPVRLLRSLKGELIALPPSIVTTKYCLNKLRTSYLEPKDLLICAFPKTGTHWHWEMMLMLARGEARHWPEWKDVGWIDVTPLEVICQTFKQPRVISTHYPLGHFSRELRNGCKVVYLLRNPKDAFVSMMYHVNTELQDRSKTQAEYLSIFLHSKYNWFGSYFDHIADAWDNYRDDPDVLFIFFEETKKNHRAAVQKMASFMGVSASESLVDQIVTATTFSTMKKAKYSSEVGWRDQYGENSSLYRKGEVGDWKNYLTVAQNEEMDRYISEWNKDRKIPFIYE